MTDKKSPVVDAGIEKMRWLATLEPQLRDVFEKLERVNYITGFLLHNWEATAPHKEGPNRVAPCGMFGFFGNVAEDALKLLLALENARALQLEPKFGRIPADEPGSPFRKRHGLN